MLKAPQAVTRTQENNTVEGNAGFQVRAHEQIVPLLIQSHKARLLFDVEIPGCDSRYTSALLGVYDRQGFLVLDELTPGAGHRQLLKRRQVTLTGKLDRVTLRFSSRLIEAREHKGVAFYKFAIPESVFYMQRRDNFRVSTAGACIPFRARRDDDTGELLRGRVADLSRSGIGLVLEGAIGLRRQENLSNCVIVAPGKERIPFSLEIRHTVVNENLDVTRTGGCFTSIDTASLHKISKIINELEREHARRANGY